MAQAPSKPHGGAFDALRLLAAFAVLISHSYALSGHDAQEPLMLLTHNQIGLGEIGIYIFFAISGYLVTQSWQRDPSALRFLMRRALRILPGLIFVITGCFAVIGPLATSLSLHDYFLHPNAWSYLTKIFVYPPQLTLPGVFADNPHSDAVNGSLWTLRLECGFYFVVTLLGIISLVRGALNIAIATLCLLMVVLCLDDNFAAHIPYARQIYVLFECAVTFFTGAALAQRKLDKRFLLMAIALCIGAAAMLNTPWFKPLLLLALPMTIIFIAHYGKCDLSKFGDYSYGIYLWAYPIQQTVMHFMGEISPLRLCAIAGVIVCAIAFLSWQLVEKNALALKPRRKHA